MAKRLHTRVPLVLKVRTNTDAKYVLVLFDTLTCVYIQTITCVCVKRVLVLFDTRTCVYIQTSTCVCITHILCLIEIVTTHDT